jgi:hypothetical protein
LRAADLVLRSQWAQERSYRAGLAESRGYCNVLSPSTRTMLGRGCCLLTVISQWLSNCCISPPGQSWRVTCEWLGTQSRTRETILKY